MSTGRSGPDVRRLAPAVALVLLLLGACGPGSRDQTSGLRNDKERVTLDPANAEQDGAAETELKQALETANDYYFDTDNSYEGFDAAAAAGIDSETTWLDGTDPAAGEISITDATKTNVHLVTRSESGVYFCLRNLNQFGRGEYLTGYGAAFEDVDESGDCIGEGGN